MTSRPSSLVDTRIVYCGDCLEQLRQLPNGCDDLAYIDPPFNSNRNYEVFWGETKEKRSFEDRHASTQAYIEYMRPRCVEIARVLKSTGSFYYHCDWHASHYVKVMLDQIFGDQNFQNEIIWKRSTAHSDALQGSKHYGRLHDVLLFYTGGSDAYTWNHLYLPLSDSYIDCRAAPSACAPMRSEQARALEGKSQDRARDRENAVVVGAWMAPRDERKSPPYLR
ncbi:MAG: DNA-methyltransferase [Acidobacteriaceae bacterium]